MQSRRLPFGARAQFVDTIGGEIVTSAAAEMGVQVEGGTGDDKIYGAGGADRLEGGDDDDILVGGKVETGSTVTPVKTN